MYLEAYCGHCEYQSCVASGAYGDTAAYGQTMDAIIQNSKNSSRRYYFLLLKQLILYFLKQSSLWCSALYTHLIPLISFVYDTGHLNTLRETLLSIKINICPLHASLNSALRCCVIFMTLQLLNTSLIHFIFQSRSTVSHSISLRKERNRREGWDINVTTEIWVKNEQRRTRYKWVTNWNAAVTNACTNLASRNKKAAFIGVVMSCHQYPGY